MRHTVDVVIPNSSNIILELDDAHSPKTMGEFIKNLPFSLTLNVWGDEIYTKTAAFRLKS
jgi:hypothetical protein